jgi:cob(I)alamin adenosyltransferase
MDASDEADRNERHRQRMEKKKAVVDAKIAQAVEERGVIVVATGNGKGKSTSGFGMLARALGHGMQVGVVQFIKGSFSTGEEAFFRRFPEVRYFVMGEGYTWETQDRERDIAKAAIAWKVAAEMLSDSAIQLVLLDELNIVLKLGYLQVADVIAALERRPAMQHVMITGRGAPPELVEVADTVTHMQPIKHAFDAGVRAQKGVEL